MREGIVEFFDIQRGFGKIRLQDEDELAFVHISDVVAVPKRPLVPGDLVRFEVKSTNKGLGAIKVSPLEERQQGTVINYNHRKGYGFISSDVDDNEYFVHNTDIVTDKKFRALEEGDDVTFVSTTDERDRPKALKVFKDPRMPLEKFAFLRNFDARLNALRGLAQPEDWSYKHHSSPHEYPVLWNYIHYTFKKIQLDSKISYAQDNNRNLSCFNTGLVTENFEPIFAVFQENKNTQANEQWILDGFYKESQYPVTLFAHRPEPANYFTNPSDLIYDSRMDLVCNVDHIIDERLDRFPSTFQKNTSALATLFRVAIETVKRRVRQNYKTAIPQFNRGQTQLLLPLCLEDPMKADVALVVGREGNVYKGYTVITLDMAYNNARLLTRPDREWLIP